MQKLVALSVIIACGILLTLSVDSILMREYTRRSQERLTVETELARTALKQALDRRINAVTNLGILFRIHPELSPEEFKQIAAGILAEEPEIQALQYADNTTQVKYVYPTAGNEVVIKKKIVLLDDPKRGIYTRTAIDLQKTTVQPPFILRHGMLGTVARMPLFQGNRFLGLAIGVFDLDRILKDTIKSHEFTGLTIQLYDDEGNLFYGTQDIIPNANRRTIAFGTSFWTIRVSNQNSAYDEYDVIRLTLWGVGGLITLLLCTSALLFINQNSRLKAKIEETSLRYRTIFNNLNEAVYVYKMDVAGRSSTFIEVNDAATRMIGYTRKELLEKTVHDLRDAAAPAPPAHIYQQDDQTKLVTFDTVHLTANGRRIPVEVSPRIFYYNDERYIVSIVLDVSERKYFERQLTEKNRILKDMNRQLEQRVSDETERRLQNERLLMQQSKLAAMGEMIGAIAHQWRQPLNAIGLLVQDISDQQIDGSLSNDSMEDTVHLIMDQLKYMSDTINDFRNFFIPEKNRERFLVSATVSQAMNLVSVQLANKGITSSLKKPHAEVDYTFGHRQEFLQAIINIINNAQQAVMTYKEHHPQADTQKPDIRVEIITMSESVNIMIENTGLPIPSDIIDRIFEPYFTTKHKEQGTGLGLYMVKMIIENDSGGTVSVENREDGVAFVISLPRA